MPTLEIGSWPNSLARSYLGKIPFSSTELAPCGSASTQRAVRSPIHLSCVNRLNGSDWLINTPDAFGAVALLGAATMLIAAFTLLMAAESSPARILQPMHSVEEHPR